MPQFFARIPAAALRREFDGNLYAYVGHRFDAATLQFVECEARMLKVSEPARIEHGEAFVHLATVGEAIAPRFVPFGITREG